MRDRSSRIPFHCFRLLPDKRRPADAIVKRSENHCASSDAPQGRNTGSSPVGCEFLFIAQIHQKSCLVMGLPMTTVTWHFAPRMFRRQVQALTIREICTSPRSPWQNPYAERVISSIRRQCLDHRLALSKRHFRRILGILFDQYHGTPSHLSLYKDTLERLLAQRPDQERIFELIGSAPPSLVCTESTLNGKLTGTTVVRNAANAATNLPQCERYPT